VHLDTEHHVGAIDRRIFGGFLEHLGRAIYEGVYDPGNPLSDERGFRRDVIESLRSLDMPVIRYPGGNFVSTYNWQDGVGPREKRPARPDYAWKSIESNQFGTDEFMAWCATLQAQPMLAVNLGTEGTAKAAQLLEYTNLPGDTYWAAQRIANGRADPYAVKYWCLGNEMDGPWQAGHVPANIYAQRAEQAAVVMRGLDPTIETVVCGSSHHQMPTYMDWDRLVLDYCWDQVDYISAHQYSSNSRQDSAWFLAEGVMVDRIVDDYAALLAYVRAVKRSPKRVYLSFDEWNVWYRERSGDGNWQQAPHLLEEHYNLEDALVCAQYLASFIRHADVVKMACIAQIVNAIAVVCTKSDGLLQQSIYHAFQLFSRHAHGRSLRPAVACPTYHAGDRGEVPTLDVAASYDPATETASVFLINRGLGEEADVTIGIADRKIDSVPAVHLLGGDVHAGNTWHKPNAVVPEHGEARLPGDGTARVRVPAPGLAVVQLRLGRR